MSRQARPQQGSTDATSSDAQSTNLALTQMSASQTPMAGPATPATASFGQLNAAGAFADPKIMLATIAAMASTMQQQQASHNGPSAPQTSMQSINTGQGLPQPNGSVASLSPQVAAAKMLAGGGGGPGFNTSHLTQHQLAALIEMSTTSGSSTGHPLAKIFAARTGAPAPALHKLHNAISHSGGSASGSTNGRAAAQPAQAASFRSNQYTNAALPGMQAWSLHQLEHHVKMLQQMNQSIPQTVAILLYEARRKDHKRAAKRVANRKSACTSRARKKALVEEMTKTNARLRRHALILSLLPDLVVAMTLDGEINFCSSQVENVLRYNPDDLMGVTLEQVTVPSSREALGQLIKELLKDEKPKRGKRKRRSTDRQNNNSDANDSKTVSDNSNGNSNGSGQTTSQGRRSNAAVVSVQSFPLSIVEVDSKREKRKTSEACDTSDNSTGNGSGKQQTVSSLTNSNSRSPTADGSLGEDEAARGDSAKLEKKGSGDDSSSLSSDTKNMNTAHDSLDRNVRLHNKQMNQTKKCKGKGPKDDVTGASVTENNASARLSSLIHVPEAKGKKEKTSRYESHGEQSSSDDSLLASVEEKKNASDDSGYRESNDSREETSSSSSDMSSSKGRRHKSLSPTSKICLIRSDLTTVWCEVTSSIRTRTIEEETGELFPPGSPPQSEGTPPPEVEAAKQVREILLCLRPIRDGDKTVDEIHRLKPMQESELSSSKDEETLSSSSPSAPVAAISASSAEAKKESSSLTSDSPNIKGGSATTASVEEHRNAKRSPKKRVLPTHGRSKDGSKRRRREPKRDSKGSGQSSDDTEKSVVESLMLMKGT